MEILLLIAAIVVLLGGTAVFLVARRDRGEVGIEPPPAEGAVLTRPEEVRDAPVAEDEAVVEASATAAVVVEDVVVVEPPAPVAPEPIAPARRPSFRERLGKARAAFTGYLTSLLSRSEITEETWDELEEAMIRADVGVTLTTALLDDLKATVAERGITAPAEMVSVLKDQLVERLSAADTTLRYEPGGPNVWLFVGVNGVGKTTSIGKVGKQQVDAGRSVLMAAGDTFRAAAAEQLETWATRAGTAFHRAEEGSDPSSVIFDAVAKAGARDIDLVLADTAGRLHTKSNLMDELAKVRRVADREPGRVTEVLLVLDATTGQNGLQQAKQFSEATQCTGVVLTKLDGSAKGGVAMAIALDLGLPIKLVGLGESVEDLVEFEPRSYVEALFET